jgi:hypothetical protein
MRLERPLSGFTVNGVIPKINMDPELVKTRTLVRRPAILNGELVATGTNPTLQPGDVLELDP